MSDHTTRAHSEHGGSIVARWWNCPGSVAAVRGLPNESGEAAARGTAAHELAERCLRSDQNARSYVGATHAGVTIDHETAQAVQVYVDECRHIAAEADWHAVEVRFDLAPLNPPAPMFGTADFVAYVAETQTLRIRDYKNGWVAVDARRNPQLMFYALGALVALGADKPVSDVEIGIVQPNTTGDAVKTDTLGAVELAEWSVELMARAAATLAPDAPLVPGEWCRKTYCPARASCPARRTSALAVARAEFGSAPGVSTFSRADLAALLHRLPMLEQWVADVKDAGAAYARRGELPGWKLVQADGRTAWTNAEAAAALLRDFGLDDEQVYQPRVPVTPATARDMIAERLHAEAKAAGRKLTKKDATADARTALAPVTFTPPSSSGPRLVPESDPRPALGAPGADFAHAPIVAV